MQIFCARWRLGFREKVADPPGDCANGALAAVQQLLAALTDSGPAAGALSQGFSG